MPTAKARTLSILLVSLALVGAGCVGQDDAPVAAAATDAEIQNDPDTSQDAPPSSAGSSQEPTPEAQPETNGATGTTEDAADETATDAAPAPLRAVPFTWDGSTRARACLPSGQNSCMGPGVPVDADDLKATGLAGRAAAVINVTWEAQTPLGEELEASLWAAETCGDGCWQSVGDIGATARGTSPLTLTLDEVTLPAGATLVITVSHVRLPTPDPTYAVVGPGQAFHVEGTLYTAA